MDICLLGSWTSVCRSREIDSLGGTRHGLDDAFIGNESEMFVGEKHAFDTMFIFHFISQSHTHAYMNSNYRY